MVIWLNWLSPSEGGLVSLRGSKNENLGDKNLYSLLKYYSFPGGSEDKESAFSTGDPGLIPRLGRSSGEEMVTHSSILAWEFHGQRSLVGYNPWGCKESDTT